MTLSKQVAQLVAEKRLFEAESLVMNVLADQGFELYIESENGFQGGEFKPESKENCYLVLASIHAARGDFGECLRALDVSGKDTEAAIFLLAQMGFYDEAALRLEAIKSPIRKGEVSVQSVPSESSNPQLGSIKSAVSVDLFKLATKAKNEGLNSVAEDCYKLSLNIEKTAEGFLGLSEVCWQNGKKQEALDVLWSAKNQFPLRYEIFTKLGYYLLLQGNKRGALESLLKARSLGDHGSFCASLFLWCEGI